VVDAGGQGLLRALEGALAALDVAEIQAPDAEAPTASTSGPPTVAPVAQREAPDGTWGYETVFLIHARDPLDPGAVRDGFAAIGESVLVAGDERMVKVHIHNQRPDEAIALGLSLGVLSQLTIQNLDEQTSEAHHQYEDAARPDGGASGGGPQSGQGARSLAVVAIAHGPGLAKVFESFGVDEILPSPLVGNPSTGEIVEALRRLDAAGIVILPNDPNVVLAAEQAARAIPDRDIVVVPTRSAPEGFAALLAMDREAGPRENLAPMLAAARDVQTLLVARADRDSRLGGHDIAAGQYVVLRPGEGLGSVADDPVTAVDEAVARLDDGFELLTFYIGDGGSEEEAGEAIRRIVERRPGTEAEVLPGGQPHYRYLISVE
jgi:hypothetical protein